MALKLIIGNKNYSSWSMRAGVLLQQAGIPFEEKLIKFDSFGDADSPFGRAIPPSLGSLEAASKRRRRSGVPTPPF